ncbi:hypothetical protein PAPYR_10899 [Paratrimastix pyriformis]|uniref:Uncharacterized protein n=3 Tax=Paratrimastix pyriformis TaxID=342808 RepID=A0ABQ8U4Y1_9EUKA|nr:hypothetical protein PAPYR_10899 [Paratrimastix pyriformis]
MPPKDVPIIDSSQFVANESCLEMIEHLFADPYENARSPPPQFAKIGFDVTNSMRHALVIGATLLNHARPTPEYIESFFTARLPRGLCTTQDGCYGATRDAILEQGAILVNAIAVLIAQSAERQLGGGPGPGAHEDSTTESECDPDATESECDPDATESEEECIISGSTPAPPPQSALLPASALGVKRKMSNVIPSRKAPQPPPVEEKAASVPLSSPKSSPPSLKAPPPPAMSKAEKKEVQRMRKAAFFAMTRGEVAAREAREAREAVEASAPKPKPQKPAPAPISRLAGVGNWLLKYGCRRIYVWRTYNRWGMGRSPPWFVM